ncbi:hypothetical protein TIFTF001_028990 [Ficus carica]|uniref:Uncharacterized protein n=1 Tax=Ficus carica TaxID=3494 RepID=A0AA88DR06_FICCA|nr:hypothetical protein TIFTF001_028990 [Ficus carica]
MKGCYHTSGFGPSYRSGSPSYHFLSDKFKILHYGNVSTFITAYGDAKREDDYLEFLLWPSNQGCIISSFDDLLLMRKRVVLCASPIAPATPNFDNLDKLEEEEEDYLHLRLRTRLHLHPHITVRGQAMKARLGVVRGRLRLAHFYFDVRSNTYVLKAWELLYDDDYNHNNNASWDLVHDVLIKRSDESVKLALVALHPEDGDTFFLTRIISREIRHEGYDLFQYKIGSSDDVELVCRCRNGFCAFPLVHPWWPTTIPSLPPST